MSNKDVNYNIWLDRSSGMIVKMECKYFSNGNDSIESFLYYRYQLNNVSDDMVVKPNLEGYSIVEL